MSTLLFELRPPACCENNSPIPPIDLYPSWLCEKCFTANCNVQPSPTSAMMTQNHNCRVCGDKVGVSIFTRPFSYPTLTLTVKEVLNLLYFRNPPYDYMKHDYNSVVVKISRLVMDGSAKMEVVGLRDVSHHAITANLTYLPETRMGVLNHLHHKKASSGAPFSHEDMITLGLMNSLFNPTPGNSESWRRWTRAPFTPASPGGPRA